MTLNMYFSPSNVVRLNPSLDAVQINFRNVCRQQLSMEYIDKPDSSLETTPYSFDHKVIYSMSDVANDVPNSKDTNPSRENVKRFSTAPAPFNDLCSREANHLYEFTPLQSTFASLTMTTAENLRIEDR
jgi:hypothetical protein